MLRESRELHGDLESMAEKVELLSEVLQVEALTQQVCELSRHAEELQQSIKTRLQSLQDADKVSARHQHRDHTGWFRLVIQSINIINTAIIQADSGWLYS